MYLNYFFPSRKTGIGFISFHRNKKQKTSVFLLIASEEELRALTFSDTSAKVTRTHFRAAHNALFGCPVFLSTDVFLS